MPNRNPKSAKERKIRKNENHRRKTSMDGIHRIKISTKRNQKNVTSFLAHTKNITYKINWPGRHMKRRLWLFHALNEIAAGKKTSSHSIPSSIHWVLLVVAKQTHNYVHTILIYLSLAYRWELHTRRQWGDCAVCMR